MIDKPENMNQIWAENGDVVNPGAAVIDAGWPTLDPATGDPAPPPHTYMNYIQNKMTKFLAHVNEYGIAVWDATTTYTTESWARSPVDNKVYVSTIGNNLGHEPSVSLSQWSIFDISANIGDTLESYETPLIMESRGYLLQNGQAVSRTTYSDLFALIGTDFGPGDGTTTFNLPSESGATPEPVLISRVITTTTQQQPRAFLPSDLSFFVGNEIIILGTNYTDTGAAYRGTGRLVVIPNGVTNIPPDSLSFVGKDLTPDATSNDQTGTPFAMFYWPNTEKFYMILSGFDLNNSGNSGIYSISRNATENTNWTKDSTIPFLFPRITSVNRGFIQPATGSSIAWALMDDTVYKYDLSQSSFEATILNDIPGGVDAMTTFYEFQQNATVPDLIFFKDSKILKGDGETGTVNEVKSIDEAIFGELIPHSIATDGDYLYWVSVSATNNQKEFFVRADKSFNLSILLERDVPPASFPGNRNPFSFNGGVYHICDSFTTNPSEIKEDITKYTLPDLSGKTWIKSL